MLGTTPLHYQHMREARVSLTLRRMFHRGLPPSTHDLLLQLRTLDMYTKRTMHTMLRTVESIPNSQELGREMIPHPLLALGDRMRR